MANEEHLEILKQGVEVWNQWRDQNPEIQPDLSGADLIEAHLAGANLRGANLRGAQLVDANLHRVHFEGADLRRANLTGAILWAADFSQANLSEANLSSTDLYRVNLRGVMLIGTEFNGAHLRKTDFHGADLSLADLSRANLTRADLGEANLGGATIGLTVFADVDLSVVNGLNTGRHIGPSTLGIDTIYRSQGKIPEAFLRECGLSDIQIEMAKLHNPDLSSEQVTNIINKIHELYVAGPVQYYSCFISYSHQDEGFAQRLYKDLQSEGVRCWYPPEEIKIGDEIRPSIDQAIRVRDKLLLILSEHSINSTWVKKEVETAFEEEDKRKQTVLFPVRLDKTVMETDQAWAADIRRTRHIGDFSRWKNRDAYQKAFERLLRDLKTEE